eukprot:m.199692 g.199692  ORF g.199692 m.199692 type:complete len:361 (+) comp15323_c0_seq1:73-1155(+)
MAYTQMWGIPGGKQSEQGCTTLSDGRVFICGGWNGRDSLSSACIYSPLDNSFTKVRNLPSERKLHGCTALSDGRVFICGGSNGRDRLSSAYIYSPRNDSYTNVRDLTHERGWHGCSALPDGKVYICKGDFFDRAGKESYLSDAYVYSPPSPTLPPTPSPQGSFQAKAETLEAWLTEAEWVLLSVTGHFQASEKKLHQRCDAEVARAREECDDRVACAQKEFARAVCTAEQRREVLVQQATDGQEQAVQRATQKRDQALDALRLSSNLSEIEMKVQTIRVEAEENRQMASILAGQSPPPVSAPAPAPRNECVVCIDNEASFVIVPCGHVCLCEECKDALVAGSRKCPKCRGAIDNTFKVFL